MTTQTEVAPPDECEDVLVLTSASRGVRANHGDGGLRDLAASGGLRQAACSGDARGLRSEAFGLVLPLVWQRHTGPLQLRKGHRRCSAGICCLEPECAAGFTDDVESVVTALL